MTRGYIVDKNVGVDFEIFMQEIREESEKYFNAEVAGKIYAAINSWGVYLEDDLMKYGASHLRRKTTEVRNMLTECERMYSMTSQKAQALRKRYRETDKALSMVLKRLYAADPTVRAEKHVKDREALALYMVHDINIRVQGLELAVAEMEGLLSVLKIKRGDLRNLIQVLKDIQSSCQQEIRAGIAVWGSQDPRDATMPAIIPRPALVAGGYVDSLINEVSYDKQTGHEIVGDSSTPADNAEGMSFLDLQPGQKKKLLNDDEKIDVREIFLGSS